MRWLEQYADGQHERVWSEITRCGSGLRSDPALLVDARRVARETMKRARSNVERLVESLPGLGYQFSELPLVDPEPSVAGWRMGDAPGAAAGRPRRTCRAPVADLTSGVVEGLVPVGWTRSG